MAEIIPIYNVVILPHSTVFFTSDSYLEATEKKQWSMKKYILRLKNIT